MSAAVASARAAVDSARSNGGDFECSVCLDTATNPCVSPCGHLFCWGCIHPWLDGGKNSCPVCKAHIAYKDDASGRGIIPLYTRGASEDGAGPAASGAGPSIPERPRPVRQEAPPAGAAANPFGNMFGGNNGVQFQAFGFPFMMGGAFTFGGGGVAGAGPAIPLSPEEQRRVNLSRIFLFAGIAILLAILNAA